MSMKHSEFRRNWPRTSYDTRAAEQQADYCLTVSHVPPYQSQLSELVGLATVNYIWRAPYQKLQTAETSVYYCKEYSVYYVDFVIVQTISRDADCVPAVAMK